eukprot:GEMP01080718.1.p1 GENE.GEMP01080718.1~~GEMP01080718.1.p1  ORF type:complete len:123 (+),score=15.54 GEMP01080718.1:606-974(+)
MIYDLCEDYCKPANTVIVTCFCCNDDMENQAIRKLARDVDDCGARTVGVLTKPDLIHLSTEDTWLQIFNNRKYPLTKGYYVVRNRTQAELDGKVRTLGHPLATRPWVTFGQPIVVGAQGDGQ